MEPMEPQAIRDRAAELREQETIINLVLHRQILKTWETLSPKMWKRLQADNLAEDLALVVQAAMWESKEQYQKAGMPPTDAREQAEREWLMLEPEEEEEEEEA